MKALLLAIFAMLLAACAADQRAKPGSGSSPAGQASPASANQAETAKAAKMSDSSSTVSAESGDRPVEFTSLGITPDKETIAYRIKILTTTPIEEVHLALKESDGAGKVVEDTTIVWQNIVGTTRQPIETGKTYEDRTTLDPGAARAECSLKEVVFKDGTRWNAR